MFDFGFTELLLILSLFFLFVRVQDLPRLCYKLGQYYRQWLVLKSKTLDMFHGISYDYKNNNGDND
eukprot:COSAG01_NODE_52_length_31456_cov_125.226648_8_plen_66_part_00